MRWLVLGGTSFLSREVARTAVARGHEVVCAARGRSGAVPDGARLLAVDRGAPDALAPLAGEAFDAVVDVASATAGWVRAALEALGDRAGHWTFVSTVNVYADTVTHGQGPGAPLVPPLDTADLTSADATPEAYGGIKVASEDAVRDRLGDRALLVRPGVITGPGDVMDRLGTWAARFARGGRAVVPDVPGHPFQHVDVRDLAAFVVDAGERGRGGTVDAVGAVLDLPQVLREVAAAVGADDLEPVPVPPETLVAAGVAPWAGPRSLPFWLPAEVQGLVAHDPEPARAAGLAERPVADAARDALADERARGLDRPRAAGLSADDERDVLALVARS